MSDGEAEPPWSGPVQRETAQWEREKILHEEKEEGGGGWGGWGTAVTGWRTQPPATQRGNNNRTLHLIFRTSPLASTAGSLLAAAALPAPSRHNTSQNTAR